MGSFTTLKRICSERDGRLGLVFTLVILIFAIVGPLVSPDPNLIDVKARFAPPGAAHLLGTDNLGRDLVARTSAGTRYALALAAMIVVISSVVGSLIGVVAAVAGPRIDRVITGVFDIVNAFPPLILAFALIALYGKGPITFVLLVTVVFIPQFGRMARARAQSLRSLSFIEAERMLAVHPATIVARHYLPNVAGPIIVLASMNLPVVIAFEASLSFLGFGVQPPKSSLGTLIKDGFVSINQSWWPIIAASLVLAIATLGATLLGEALRRVIDPKTTGAR
ncbi:ABC transporter permease [Aminobacter sp. P9b]|uniref:ABC transporter permease n=1 Tax=Aminobacter sp. P9b TaxID=3133697 RepID=UPI003250C90B